jgi:hypothetical protein
MGTVRSLMYLCIVLVAACGRVGFDERTATVDAADAAPRPSPTFVANAGATAEANATTLRVNVPTTTIGNLLVVTFTIHTDAAVTSIVDDGGNTYISTSARASMAGTSSEVWYADQRAPATTVDIVMDKAGSFNAYTLELAGVRGLPAKKSSACLLYPPTFVTSPITTTVPDELIVTVTMFAFPLFVSAMRPPFVGLPPQSGNATGYLIAREPGTYESTFDIESGEGMSAMTCASSVSWTP